MDTINTDDCWLNAGFIDTKGYGQIFFKLDGKRIKQPVHRASYETFIGKIPDGLVIDHLCRVRSCFNPLHLEPVTRSVNTLRGEGVLANKRKTHCPQGHEYTPNNTLYSTNNWRVCRQCHRDRKKRDRALKKGK